MNLAGIIIRYWLRHDLDHIKNITSKWVPGYILERLKWETLSKILGFIAAWNGYKANDTAFISDVMRRHK